VVSVQCRKGKKESRKGPAKEREREREREREIRKEDNWKSGGIKSGRKNERARLGVLLGSTLPLLSLFSFAMGYLWIHRGGRGKGIKREKNKIKKRGKK
jgi:hypothetical protein